MVGDGGEMNRNLYERELDAALVRYGAVEPRAGLEGRVLANLCAERERRVVVRRWLWPAVAGLALATAIVVLAFVWSPRSVAPGPVAQEKPNAAVGAEKAPVTIKKNVVAEATRVARPVKRIVEAPVRYATATSEKAPKLDQFPSPEPLSEQERLLMRYANADPDALLFAQARADELQKELEDRGAE